MEITNALIKFVSSLSQKKYRDAEGCFTAEGTKCVLDTWDFFEIKAIFATQSWYELNANNKHRDDIVFVNKRQLQRMSQFTTTSEVIAVYHIPNMEVDKQEITTNISIVLDGVQDPGNLGTIMRLADWYGIRNIFCSKNTVDVYNHKVVQATMGAISRIHIHYCDLQVLFEDFSDMPIYGTFLDGNDIYSSELSDTGFIIFGNEGNGITSDVAKYVNKRLLIPSFAINKTTSESLNVGIAAAITISEFKRRMI